MLQRIKVKSKGMPLGQQGRHTAKNGNNCSDFHKVVPRNIKQVSLGFKGRFRAFNGSQQKASGLQVACAEWVEKYGQNLFYGKLVSCDDF